jgi:NADP-dependent 3-hydroxy acid dehydrogenase YdfG
LRKKYTIDILVNRAGVEIASAYTKYSDAELDGVIDLDLLAPLWLLEEVLPSGGVQAGGVCDDTVHRR